MCVSFSSVKKHRYDDQKHLLEPNVKRGAKWAFISAISLIACLVLLAGAASLVVFGSALGQALGGLLGGLFPLALGGVYVMCLIARESILNTKNFLRPSLEKERFEIL